MATFLPKGAVLLSASIAMSSASIAVILLTASPALQNLIDAVERLRVPVSTAVLQSQIDQYRKETAMELQFWRKQAADAKHEARQCRNTVAVLLKRSESCRTSHPRTQPSAPKT